MNYFTPIVVASLLSILLALPVRSHADGQTPDRSTSSRSTAEWIMASRNPSFEADTNMSGQQLSIWQQAMSHAMAKLMRHPSQPAKESRLVTSVQRPGYRLERWMSYPLGDSRVAYLVLIPDGVNSANPAPAALCIPGFGQTKELLAGELEGNFDLEGNPDATEKQAAMAKILARHGMVAVAVDNPSCGELSDNGHFDYLATSRFLLETGWSYLGLASWQDRVILEDMKRHPAIDPQQIILSGFSLGTEPMMVLGLLDSDIKAFVYNDFLCRTRERALTMNAPDQNGLRNYPNSDEHLIPEFLTLFDFPDIVAALAPRPVICTEGGLDRDFRIIAKMYDLAGAPDAFQYHHYAKFADPASRQPIQQMPSGIDRSTFFRLANVDPPNHYFKAEHILPWLHELGYISDPSVEK